MTVVSLAVSLLVTIAGVLPATTSASVGVPAGCASTLVAPVDGPIVGRFRAPDCKYCPGRRGVVFGSVPGAAVRAPAGGRVLYAGRVAGVLYVVIGDPRPGGLRVTIGRLTALAPGLPVVAPMPSGAADASSPDPDHPPVRVTAGQTLGTAGESTWLGVRVGDRLGGVSLDPLLLLRRWRISLVPSGRRSVGCPTVVTPSRDPGAGRRP